jgi:hypothetical protein
LKGTNPQSIAFDPLNPDSAYCGTFGDGLWKTNDGGQTWNNIGRDIILSPYVMSVAVSSVSSGNRSSKVYVGTEPSALYISNAGHYFDAWTFNGTVPGTGTGSVGCNTLVYVIHFEMTRLNFI